MAVDSKARILGQLAQRLRISPALLYLLAINLAVFALYHIVCIPFRLLNRPLEDLLTAWLAVPPYLPRLILKPWTLITYMFFHQGLWHILFNLLWLWFFGRMFLMRFSSQQLTALYIMGGLAGALLYIAVYNLFPYFQPLLPFSVALGASAAIMAITLAVAIRLPDERVYLYGVLAIRLKWLAVIIILLDLLSITGSNAGGHIAHIGGAILGITFALALRRGVDITRWLWADYWRALLIPVRPGRRKPPSGNARGARRRAEEHPKGGADATDAARVEAILRKLSQGGYACLTAEEKALLFRQKR